MIPMQRLATKDYGREESKDYQRDNLLYHLQLHKREWASVADESDSVGRDLT